MTNPPTCELCLRVKVGDLRSLTALQLWSHLRPHHASLFCINAYIVCRGDRFRHLGTHPPSHRQSYQSIGSLGYHNNLQQVLHPHVDSYTYIYRMNYHMYRILVLPHRLGIDPGIGIADYHTNIHQRIEREEDYPLLFVIATFFPFLIVTWSFVYYLRKKNTHIFKQYKEDRPLDGSTPTFPRGSTPGK